MKAFMLNKKEKKKKIYTHSCKKFRANGIRLRIQFRFFFKLKYPEKYPEKLIDSAINRLQHPTDSVQTPSDSPVRITLPFKDHKSADVVCRQLGDLGTKIIQQLQPVHVHKQKDR